MSLVTILLLIVTYKEQKDPKAAAHCATSDEREHQKEGAQDDQDDADRVCEGAEVNAAGYRGVLDKEGKGGLGDEVHHV